MSSAAMARLNGLVPGMILEGQEGDRTDRIQITAVGNANVLAMRIATKLRGVWDAKTDPECVWSLLYRQWTKVDPLGNTTLDAVLSLCVRERLHPECDPAVRWVVTLPGSWGEGYPTREAACEAVLARAEGGA